MWILHPDEIQFNEIGLQSWETYIREAYYTLDMMVCRDLIDSRKKVRNPYTSLTIEIPHKEYSGGEGGQGAAIKTKSGQGAEDLYSKRHYLLNVTVCFILPSFQN